MGKVITAQHPDGATVFAKAFGAGLKPDPPLYVDEWAVENMIIPADTGAKLPGPYRLDTTPFARDVMRELSPCSPCKRVVAKVASQLWKTQVGINWMSACIARAPANILALEPTQTLTTRLAARMDKTIAAVPVLREKVAQPRSRDARNTMGVKEFRGGAMYLATAGSESNLAELSARYIYGDEIDRWKRQLGQEGDPVKLAENRTTQFGKAAKCYYSSSPTEKDVSKIQELFEMGDQRYCYVPCPHCGHMQVLVIERIRVNEDQSIAYYGCENDECGCLIEEHNKQAMFNRYEWRAHASGDGETVSFTQNALYAPLGSVGWLDLWKEWKESEAELVNGNDALMRVFYNTRLALVYDSRQQVTTAEALHARAEPYQLRTIPEKVYVLTAAVDTQGDRLELKIVGWGEGMESWIIDYEVIVGSPSHQLTWDELDKKLLQKFRHPCGKEIGIRAVLIDSGGHNTQDVYQFTRLRQYRHVHAIKGSPKSGRPVIAVRPSKVDVTWQGVTEPEGAMLWQVGTDTAKDWITNRFSLTGGPGAIHFSQDLPLEYYQQLTAERKSIRYVKGYKRVDWVKPNGARNEAFDLAVYNLAAAHYIGMHKWTMNDWEKLKIYFDQGDLFNSKPVESVEKIDEGDAEPVESIEVESEKPTPVSPAHPPLQPSAASVQRRVSVSGYLRRR